MDREKSGRWVSSKGRKREKQRESAENCLIFCNQRRAEEGKSIKIWREPENEIQEVGGLDPPVPPPPYPFLTIKSETWIKNGECGNLTTGKRIKEEGKKVMAVKVKVSQLLLVREFMQVVIWGFWQYFFLHHLDKRINCCPTCSIWWKGVGWYATSKCILLMGQAVTFIGGGGGGESLIPHELVGFSEISPPQPLLPSCILILI